MNDYISCNCPNTTEYHQGPLIEIYIYFNCLFGVLDLNPLASLLFYDNHLNQGLNLRI